MRGGSRRAAARPLAVAGALAALLAAGTAPASLAAAPAAPATVRPPGTPWTLVNALASPPAVSWSGPPLVIVDSPEDLTGPLLRSAPGGLRASHLLYADGPPRLSGTVWLLVYVKNALASTGVRIVLTVAPRGAARVRYARGASAHVGPNGLDAGAGAAAAMFAPRALGFGPAQTVAAGGRVQVAWTVPPGQVLAAWWPVDVTTSAGAPAPFALDVWEAPAAGALPAAPPSALLPAGTSGVVRTTVPHAFGRIDWTVPAAGSWALDLDNDAPTPAGGPGGDVCPPWVCVSGEVALPPGSALTAAADPLPGEIQGGVDAVDAPGRAPAAAVARTGGALLRTGNYGDYGTIMTVRLRAPAGRVVYAALVPGFDHAIPWAGDTAAGGRTAYWHLPPTSPPLGTGYLVASGAAGAVVRSTVTAGAYAPWRLVAWTEPARPG